MYVYVYIHTCVKYIYIYLKTTDQVFCTLSLSLIWLKISQH